MYNGMYNIQFISPYEQLVKRYLQILAKRTVVRGLYGSIRGLSNITLSNRSLISIWCLLLTSESRFNLYPILNYASLLNHPKN